jgi:hypothetical protein
MRAFRGVCLENVTPAKAANNVKVALAFLRSKPKMDPALLLDEEPYLRGNGPAFMRLLGAIKRVYRFSRVL